jgi:hypothetical protein
VLLTKIQQRMAAGLLRTYWPEEWLSLSLPARIEDFPLIVADNTTLTAEQCRGAIVHMVQSSGVAKTVTLPAAKPGMVVTVVRGVATADYDVQVDPDGTETITLPTGVVGGAGKMLQMLGDDYAWARLACLTAGAWVVVDYYGTLSLEA